MHKRYLARSEFFFKNLQSAGLRDLLAAKRLRDCSNNAVSRACQPGGRFECSFYWAFSPIKGSVDTEPKIEASEKSPVYRWYYAPDLSVSAAVIVTLVITAALIGLRASRWGATLHREWIRPLNYSIRTLVKRDPVLDPRIQIFAFDAATFSLVKENDLAPADWARTLQGLVPEQPRAVLIDSDFSEMKNAPGLDALAKTLKGLPFPVIAGLTPVEPGLGDKELYFEPTANSHQIVELLRNGKPGFPDQFDSISDLPQRAQKLVGPPSQIRDAFSFLGLLEVSAEGSLPLLFRADREHVIPAASLFVAKKRGLADGRLVVEDKGISSRGDFEQLINWNLSSVYEARIRSLGDLAKRIRNREPLELPQNAVIVILPRLFPGHDRYLATPVGRLPRGMAHVATINSLLGAEWMSVLPFAFLAVIFCSLLGGVAGYLLPAIAFYPSLVGVTAWIAALGIWAFTQKNLEAPWAWAAFGFVTVALPIYRWRRTNGIERRAMLREALNGVLPASRVNSVVSGQSSFTPEPVGSVVSMMFIDIAGFAAAAELLTPDRTFGALRQTMRWLTDTVHNYGGIVANLTGEGMLAFFGYPCDGTKPLAQHADQALSCAIAIQKESLRQSVECRKLNEPVFPLRIGINTGAAYIGDLAARDRIDLTLIGGAVSHAKQLEVSCDPYCILIGATSRDMLVKLDSTELTLKRRYVSVKHSSELMEAYECDPVQDQPDLRNQAIAAHRDFIKVARKEMRWSLPHGFTVSVTGNQGTGSLSNFSESGLAVKFDRFLGVGVTMNLNLDIENGQLRDRLGQQGLLPLVCEVRWGRALGGGRYLLGLQIRNLSREQRELLLSELRGAFIDAMPNAVAA